MASANVRFYPSWTIPEMAEYAQTSFGIDITVTEDTGGAPDTWSLQHAVHPVGTGVGFNHRSLLSVTLPSGLSTSLGIISYGAVLGALLTAKSASDGKGYTYTVSFSTATLRYTITKAGGGGALVSFEFNNVISRIVLGYSGNLSGSAGPYVGTLQPYFLLVPEVSDDLVVPTDYFEGGVAGAKAWTVDGSGRSFRLGDVPKFYDFEIHHEPRARVFKRAAAANEESWEHFFEHVRGIHPFVVTDSLESGVYRLREEGQFFDRAKRRRILEPNDAWWAVRFESEVVGTI